MAIAVVSAPVSPPIRKKCAAHKTSVTSFKNTIRRRLLC